MLIQLFQNIGGAVILGVAVLILILAILSKINEHKKLKADKYIRKVSKEVLYICRYVCAVMLSGIIAGVAESILQIDVISIPIALVGVYFFNYVFNKIGKEQATETEEKYEKKKAWHYIVIALAGVGLLAVGSYFISMLTKSAGNIVTGNIEMMPSVDDVVICGPITNMQGASSSISQGSGALSNMFGSVADSMLKGESSTCSLRRHF